MTGTSDEAARDGSRQRGKANRAHRDNHSLPLRDGVATPAQLAATEQALGILLRTVQYSRTSEDIRRAGLAVRLLLDLGRKPAQLAKLQRIHLTADHREPPSAWGLVSWESAGKVQYGWWLPAGIHIDPGKGDGGETDRGAIWLPVLERTRPWLSALGCLEHGDMGPLLGSSAAEIKGDVERFRAWARAMLGPLGRALPTTKRLSGALAEQLAWQPNGDRALANQVSGRDMKRSASRSYYSSLSTPKAARHYAKAMPSPVSELSLVKRPDAPDAIAMPAFARSAATRKHPKGAPDTMRSMLDMVGAKPDQRIRSDIDKVIDAHNSLITNVWILLGLTMASRSLTHWLPGLERIEPRSGGLVVLDKDLAPDEAPGKVSGQTPGARLGRGRIVFLHSGAREMLAFYIEHLDKLSRRQDIDGKSRELIRQHVDGLKTDGLLPFLELYRHEQAATIFAREVPPLWIKARLADLAGAPENFGRHVVRSGLLGQVQQTVIDALLGHFDEGTEPWTNGSAFDPAAYRAFVKAFFEAHFEDVAGFLQPTKRKAG